jgi:hypothetical protein
LLSEESPKSLKLSGFYKLSSGTSTYLGVVLNKCKKRLRKCFGVRNSTLHRRSLWRESKSPERDFLFKSEAVASKFSRGETLVLGSRKSEEVETSLVYLTPSGVERTAALFGLVPKGGAEPQSVLKLSGFDHGLLYQKVLAGFQARSLAQKSSRMTFQATSLKPQI